MKTVELLENMPESGQFVALWMHNGLPWADTFEWGDRVLRMYNDDKDEFEVHQTDNFVGVLESLNAKYIQEV